jgi:hypothetical protein
MSDGIKLALWYLIRASGATSLLLLTASLVLGIAATMRWKPHGFPRSVPRALHSNISLLAMTFLVIHIVTSIWQSHADVSLADAVIPFAGPTHALSLALGTLAIDLLLAIAITSAVRRHIGTRVWRAVHHSADAMWPIAFFHGIAMGTDAASWWMLLVDATCVVAIAWAVIVRTSTPRPKHA